VFSRVRAALIHDPDTLSVPQQQQQDSTQSLAEHAAMEPPSDPYHLIKAEIDQELQLMTTLQAKLFAGHAEVAESLNSRLLAAAEQLQALETAVQSMVAEPSKYGLTSAAAFGRQVSAPPPPPPLATPLQRTCPCRRVYHQHSSVSINSHWCQLLSASRIAYHAARLSRTTGAITAVGVQELGQCSTKQQQQQQRCFKRPPGNNKRNGFSNM